MEADGQDTTPKPLRELNVLLVEDNPGDRRLLAATLDEDLQGEVHVHEADHLHRAIAAVAQARFDVILLDLSLPDSRGVETVVRMRRQVNDVPIIVLTGLDDEATAAKALQEGAQDYLIKGAFDAPLLRRAIRYAIERERLVGQLREALLHIKSLRGLIPICTMCKKIRDDRGYWEQLEVYISEHTDADFTHGLCPECYQRMLAELHDKG